MGGGGGGGGCQSKGLPIKNAQLIFFRRYEDFCEFMEIFRKLKLQNNKLQNCLSEIPNPVVVYFERLRILSSKKIAQILVVFEM